MKALVARLKATYPLWVWGLLILDVSVVTFVIMWFVGLIIWR